LVGYKRILVAVDGSENASRAANVAVTLAKSLGSELIALQAIPTPPYSVSHAGEVSVDLQPYFDTARQQAKTLLDGIVKKAKNEGVNASELIIDDVVSVVDAIVNAAATRDVDLIVIGNRGRGGFTKLLLGSVSSGVTNHAHCSVLVVR